MSNVKGRGQGGLSPELRMKAARARRRLPDEGPPPPAPPGPSGSITWTPLGPSAQAKSYATGRPPVSGRVTGIAVGLVGARVYVAAQNGGVWATLDAGLTWTPLEDSEVSPSYTTGRDADALSVGSIAVRFGAATNGATDRVYVATGGQYDSIGVKVSTQGGAPGTWSLEATNLTGCNAFKIVIDPDDPTKAYVATSPIAGGRGLWQRPTSNFATWLPPSGNASAITGVYGCCDLVIAGSSATGNKRYYAAFENDRIYVSTDFNNWSVVPGFPALNTTNPPLFGIRLAASESDPNTVYALIEDARIFRLVTGTFQPVTGMPKSVLFPGGQGSGDSFIAVDPLNASTIYLGGDRTNGVEASLFKGTLQGPPWVFPFQAANTGNPANDPTWIGQGIHADMHTIAFGLNANNATHDPTNIWVGCDGGAWSSQQSGVKGTWNARNTGLATLFLYRIAQRPDTDAVIFGGGQDNGTFRLYGEQAGLQVQGGDGGAVAIDNNDPYRVMTWSNRSLPRSLDGGNTWLSSNFPPAAVSANQEYVASECPIAVSPTGTVPTMACYGSNRLWMTNDWGGSSPTSWVTLPTNTNPYLPGPPNFAQDALDGPIIAIAFASGRTVFAATFRTVYRFDLAGTWAKTTVAMGNLPPNYSVYGLAVDSASAGSFYVTLQGGGYEHVFYNAGTGPQQPGAGFVSAGLSQSMLDCPVWCAVVDPSNPASPSVGTPQFLYIGSDVGCWKGTRTAANTWSWSLFSSGLPEAPVFDLQIHQRTRLLRAVLNGRGVWEIPLDAAPGSGANPDIYLRVNYADTGRIVNGARFPWVDGAPDPTAKGFNVYHWMSADIKVRRGSLAGLPAMGSPPDYVDFAFNVGDYIDSTLHLETADSSGVDKIFVEVHNRGLTPLAAGQVRVCVLFTTVGAAGLPPLPANYATYINNGDTATNWVAGTQWHFADPNNPAGRYRLTTGVLDVRTPQVVEFDLDLAAIGLSPGDHVCAAAFITTVGMQDRLTAAISSLDQLTMQDKHVAHRNLHLVAPMAMPQPPAGGAEREAASFLVDFHNASAEDSEIDIVVDRRHFPGSLSVILPRVSERAATGWKVIEHDELEMALGEHLGRFFERFGRTLERVGEEFEQLGAALEGDTVAEQVQEARRRRVAKFDRSRIFVAGPGSPAIEGIRLPPHGHVTAAVTVQVPPYAKPGDRYRFDILQRRAGRIVGGSSYVVAPLRDRTFHQGR